MSTLNKNYQVMLDELENNSQMTPSNTKEPNWMVEIKVGDKAITSSTNHKYKEYAYIHDYKFVLTRGIEENTAHGIRPDGGVTGHDLKLIVPCSAITAAINTAFYENNEITSINLIRLSLIKNKQEAVETYTFSNCYVSGIITKGDVLGIAFRYTIVQRKSVQYEISGTKGGHASAQHDLSKSSSKK